MEIKFEQQDNKGAFFIEQHGNRLAEMTFTRAGEKRIIIDHTQVLDVLRGKGAGKQLVAAAVSHAQQNGLKIIPLCPFAKSVFDKVPEYQDVLDR